MNIIQIKNLTKIYKSKEKELCVFEDISFEVKEGEFLVIIGPSGCGKTTLLKIIAGFDKETSGSVLNKENKKVGFILQDPTLFPWKTTLGNVKVGLDILEISKEEKNKLAMLHLEIVGLKDFSYFYPNQLSGGMKQRVALARALVVNPKILLMDEPFKSLDSPTRDNLHNEIIKIWKKTKKTIIFVTHRISEAIKLGSRIIIISGKPSKIEKTIKINLSRPRNKLSKEYFKLTEEIDELLKRDYQLNNLIKNESIS